MKMLLAAIAIFSQLLIVINSAAAKLMLYKNVTGEFEHLRNKRSPRIGFSSGLSLFHKFNNGQTFDLYDVHDYTRISEFLSQLEQENPEHIKMVSIGKSSENRDIIGIQVSCNLSEFGVSKDVFWIDGGIHAREWNTPITSLILITQILHTMKIDPTYVTSMVDWLIIPVLNPDGYIYTHSQDNHNSRFWRKNRSDCPCVRSWTNLCRHIGCCGVDLNRNFGTYSVSPRNPYYGSMMMMPPPECEQFYAGNSKEAETASVMRYMASITRLRAYLSLHDFGQYWIYPYARSTKSYPTNIDNLRMLSNEIVRQIQLDSGRVYKTGSAPEVLYVAKGTSMDWAADLGVEFVFSAEMPPVIPSERLVDLDTAAGRATWRGVKDYLPQAGQDMWTAVQHIANQMVNFERQIRLRHALWS